jgi:hypothetical protein
MKVFIPHEKDRNVYFDEIINFSKSEFTFGHFKQYNTNYDIVNIQFPEAIFDLIAPTQNQLEEFELEIMDWKKYSKIIFTLNDASSHYDFDNKFGNLFKLLQKHVDGVIHLGNYSLKNYKQYFSSNCQHIVIFHPLYQSLLDNYKTENFEKRFSLDFKDKYVLAVIGSIRSMEEVRLIFKIFRSIPIKNKLLVVPNMFQFVQQPNYVPYRFRKIYKYIAEKIYCYPLKKSQYFFWYKFIEYEYMVDLVQKSTLMIIPRVKNLNSGNLFLGLTFDKPMVIPKIGNLTEVAEMFDLPVLDLKKKKYKETLKKVLDLTKSEFFSKNNYIENKKKFDPNQVAYEYDTFFKKLIKN